MTRAAGVARGVIEDPGPKCHTLSLASRAAALASAFEPFAAVHALFQFKIGHFRLGHQTHFESEMK